MFPRYWMFTAQDPSEKVLDSLGDAVKAGYTSWVVILLPEPAYLQLRRQRITVDLGEGRTAR